MVRILNQYVSPKGLVLMLLEGMFIALALLCAVRIRFWGSESGFDAYVAMPEFVWQALVFVVTLQVCFYYCDLYRLEYDSRPQRAIDFPGAVARIGLPAAWNSVFHLSGSVAWDAASSSSVWRWFRRSSSSAGRPWTASGRRLRPKKTSSSSVPESWRKW